SPYPHTHPTRRSSDLMDTFTMRQGFASPGVVTGKPISLGGSLGRREATARGCTCAIEEACKHLGLQLQGMTVAIQGYGNAGSIRSEEHTSELQSRVDL